MKRSNKHGFTIILVLIFLVGACVMLYPTISDYVNSKTQSRVVADYKELTGKLDDDKSEELLAAAEDYNSRLAKLPSALLQYEQVAGYDELLDISDGIMGFITIDKIGVELPIYHGTSEEVLNIACGHLQGSSLPVGGKSTHAVLSAHRGLPSAKLFTELDKLEVGDTFTVTVIDRVLTYEVDQIRIVLPDEVEELAIKEGEDLCTLFTCTPYGINTHRLLVRGRRVEGESSLPTINVANEAYIIDPIIVAPAAAVPMLLLLLIWLLVRYRKKKS